MLESDYIHAAGWRVTTSPILNLCEGMGRPESPDLHFSTGRTEANTFLVLAIGGPGATGADWNSERPTVP
jgi:hypothetical protein